MGLSSMKMLLVLLEIWEEELEDTSCSDTRRKNLVVAGAAFVVLFVGALRGGEVLLMEATELVKRQEKGWSKASIAPTHRTNSLDGKVQRQDRHV